MKTTRTIATCTLLALALPSLAQQDLIELDGAEYARRKAEGTLPDARSVRPAPAPAALDELKQPSFHAGEGVAKGGGQAACVLWQDPSLCDLAMQPNDDGSSQAIQLPFAVNLYGTEYTQLWINNNGNVTFDQPYGTFSADPFPNDQFVMIAPFWADVDTRDGLGEVRYCIEDSRIVITWDSVGYYSIHGDKRNTFQLILTDGSDPLLGVGNNVAFLYEEMAWTTGDASEGIDGFGGIPAVVGANLGDGTGYIQVGTFDHAGTDYDGPQAAADGVDWLDFKTIVFSTTETVVNLQPLVSGNVLCDTVRVCAGIAFDFDMEFYSPEPEQTTSVIVDAPTFPGIIIDENTTGVTAVVSGSLPTGTADSGYHTINFIASDDGDPVGVTTVTFVLHVIANPEVPVITGDDMFCDGTLANLHASGTADLFEWSHGFQGPHVTINEGGQYTVTATNGGLCSTTSEPFTVTLLPLPQPQITGATFSCGGVPVVLSTTQPYPAYQWSNGSDDPTTSVTTGSYFVSVTDEQGCVGASDIFSVQVANDPTASFAADPPSPQFPGTIVDFLDLSTGNGQNIVSWEWNFSNGQTSTDPNPSTMFSTPGTYLVQLITTTSGGCMDTTTMSYVIRAEEVVIPNIFTPNNDGVNDKLVIDNAQYYHNQLTIFNRWGQKVYEKQDYQNAWHAPDVPAGTYFLTLLLTETGKEYKGDLTILR